MKDMIVKERS